MPYGNSLFCIFTKIIINKLKNVFMFVYFITKNSGKISFSIEPGQYSKFPQNDFGLI